MRPRHPTATTPLLMAASATVRSIRASATVEFTGADAGRGKRLSPEVPRKGGTHHVR